MACQAGRNNLAESISNVFLEWCPGLQGSKTRWARVKRKFHLQPVPGRVRKCALCCSGDPRHREQAPHSQFWLCATVNKSLYISQRAQPAVTPRWRTYRTGGRMARWGSHGQFHHIVFGNSVKTEMWGLPTSVRLFLFHAFCWMHVAPCSSFI